VGGYLELRDLSSTTSESTPTVKERRVIVLGDLNDVPEAATTQILHGPPGSEIGTGGFDDDDKGDGRRLWILALRIPENQRFSPAAAPRRFWLRSPPRRC
jgi:hypothetical protein